MICRMWRLIRVFTVCKQFSHFSLGISKSHSQMYLKLKLDSSNIQCTSLFSLQWVKGLKYNKHNSSFSTELLMLIVLWFNYTSTLVGHFVLSSRKGEIEEIVEEMKERDREEKGTGMKAKKQKKYKHSPSTLTC